MSDNPHYAAWVSATGGGKNWQYMAWIEQKRREWLTYCVCHQSGRQLVSFTDWLESQVAKHHIGETHGGGKFEAAKDSQGSGG